MVEKTSLQLIFLVFYTLILSQRLSRFPIWIPIAGLLFVIISNICFDSIDFSNALITEITETQTIFKKGLFYANSFGTNYGEIGDVVNLTGTFTIHEPSTYQQGLFLKNNIGSLTIEEVEFITKSYQPMVLLKRLIKSDIARFYLYQEGDYNALNSSLYTALLSSGIHYSASISIIRAVLEKMMNEKKVRRCLLLISFIYSLLFGFSFMIVRLIISNGLSFTKYKSHNRTMLEMIIVLFFYPMALTSSQFILIYGLKCQTFIVKNREHSKAVTYSYLAFLQLNLFYRFNFIETLFFGFYRMLSGLMFLLSFLPIQGLLELCHRLILKSIVYLDFSQLLLVGKPNLLVNLVWLFVLISYQEGWTKKVLSFLLIYGQTLCLLLDASVRVLYLNVGQGDSTLIRYPHNTGAVLVDTGKPNQYSTVKKSLYQMGVKELDYLVITHPDLDHNGSQKTVMNQFNVKELIDSKYQKIDGPINFQLLDVEREYEDTNDNSLILYFSVDDTSFLFTGDASKQVEKQLMKKYPLLEVDILKLGHHGSKTSSDSMFLHQMFPSLAIISSDPNSYGHPHPEVLKSLYEQKINHLQTSTSGSIEVIITKHFKWIMNHGSFENKKNIYRLR